MDDVCSGLYEMIDGFDGETLALVGSEKLSQAKIVSMVREQLKGPSLGPLRYQLTPANVDNEKLRVRRLNLKTVVSFDDGLAEIVKRMVSSD